MDKIGPKKANRQIRLQINWGHYYSNNYLATKIQFKYLNKKMSFATVCDKLMCGCENCEKKSYKNSSF